MSTAWWQMDWVWEVTGWALCALGVVVMGWALFWDRARGRKRCPRCWYDMSAAVAVEQGEKSVWVCPECGREIGRERGLRRTKRKWRWAASAIVVLIAAGEVTTVPRVQKHGWVGAVPDVALAAFTPLGSSYWPINPGVRADGAMIRELQRRVDDRELSEYGYRVFLSRYFNKYPAENERVVLTREAWPPGEHVYAEMWWPMVLWKVDNLAIRARVVGSEAWAEQPLGPGNGIGARDIGIMPRGGRVAAIEVEIVRWNGAARTVLYHGRRRIVNALPPGEDGLTAFSDPALRESLLNEWNPVVFVDTDGTVLLRTTLLGWHPGNPRLDWSLSVRAELLRGSEVLATGEFVENIPEPGLIVDYIGNYSYRRLALAPGASVAGGIEPLRLRLTGDRRVALRDIRRTVFWAGTVEVEIGTGLRRVDPHDLDYRRWIERNKLD